MQGNKKFFLILIILIFSQIISGKNFELSLNLGVIPASGYGGITLLSRETYIKYRFNKFSVKLHHDSYDSMFLGNNNRCGGVVLINFINKVIKLEYGIGMSITGSYMLKNQISVDSAMFITYKRIFLCSDVLFYNNGFFSVNIFGISIPLKLWNTVLKTSFGIGNLINSDYKIYSSFLRLNTGVRYEF